MSRIPNWSKQRRTPLEYRNTETGARALLFRAPDSYRCKWRAVILAGGYPIWLRGFETKEAKQFRGELRDREAPELSCPECPNDVVFVGEKSAGAGVKRWYDCRECGYEAPSRVVYNRER